MDCSLSRMDQNEDLLPPKKHVAAHYSGWYSPENAAAQLIGFAGLLLFNCYSSSLLLQCTWQIPVGQFSENPAALLLHSWLANLGTDPISNYVRETAAPMKSSCTRVILELQSSSLFGNVSYGFLHFSRWCSKDICSPGKMAGSPRFYSMPCFIWLSKELSK